MIDAHPLEKALGMELYSTDFPGIGGKLKTRFEDFVVEEISENQTVLNVQDWPESTETPQIAKGESNRFVTFTVQKMGLSTMDVAHIIAAGLRISRTHVTYAGLKDKRAITTQSLSVPSKVVESLRTLELSRIAIRDIHYTRNPIQIGDLWGILVCRDLVSYDLIHILLAKR
jgi:tRNA pseudouridine13 synthase